MPGQQRSDAQECLNGAEKRQRGEPAGCHRPPREKLCDEADPDDGDLKHAYRRNLIFTANSAVKAVTTAR